MTYLRAFIIFTLLSFISVTALAKGSRAISHNNASAVKVEATTKGPLLPGKPIEVTLKLTFSANGNPVTPDDLKEVQTKKINVMAIDQTLTDYQNLSSLQGKNPGEYIVTFTPKSSGDYKLWVDITPLATKWREYDAVQIKSAKNVMGKVDKEITNQVTINGLTFHLYLDSDLIEGKTVWGRITVTENDKPFAELEPIRGSYAYMTGFNENFKDMLYISPEENLKSENGHGVPEIKFHINHIRPGYIKIFAEVRIEGKDIVVPFGVMAEKNKPFPFNIIN